MKESEFFLPRQKNLIPEDSEPRHELLLRLQDALRHSWGSDTCADWEKYGWASDNPAFGQCAVTALVVQDFVGGIIVKDPDHDHYWNLLDDETEVDLTREQFNESVVPVRKETRERGYMLTNERSIKARTPDRYNILRDRVIGYLTGKVSK